MQAFVIYITNVAEMLGTLVATLVATINNNFASGTGTAISSLHALQKSV